MKALLLVLLAATPTQDAPAPPDSVEVECPTCEGSGAVVHPCWLCEATGRIQCSVCHATEPHPGSRLDFEPPAPIAIEPEPVEVDPNVEDLREVVKVLEKMELGERFVIGGGRLDCINSFCEEGRVGSKAAKCDWCKGKGDIKCEDCHGKGQIKCLRCDGKRNKRIACPSCVGAGKVVFRRDASTCAWCGGSEERACGACPKNPPRKICLSCRGAKELKCKTCLGTGRFADKSCAGSGGSKKRPCRWCSGHGWRLCHECNGNEIPCEACDGKGKVSPACPTCEGDQRAACQACSRGQHGYWKTAGRYWLNAGDAVVAREHFARALERCRASFATRLGVAKPDQKDALRAEFDRETKAIEELLQQASG